MPGQCFKSDRVRYDHFSTDGARLSTGEGLPSPFRFPQLVVAFARGARATMARPLGRWHPFPGAMSFPAGVRTLGPWQQDLDAINNLYIAS